MMVKPSILLLLLILFITGCGKNDNKAIIKGDTGLIQTDKIKCLEDKLAYIKHGPDNLSDFANNIGLASLECKTERSHIKEYTRSVLREHSITIDKE